MTYMVERRANFKYQNHPVLVMYGRQVTKKDLATLVQQMDSNMDFESAVELVDKLLAQHPDGDTQAVRKILEFEMMEALMESEVRDEQELIVASLVNLMRMDNADPDEVLGDFPENIQEAVRSRMQFEDEFAADDYAGDYMVQSDVARIMDSAARLTMMTPPDETYSEWWKSQLSVVADKIDGLADYLEDRYADETDGMDAETFEAPKTMSKSQAQKKFITILKPYWLKSLKAHTKSLDDWFKKSDKTEDDLGYYEEDWGWWNNHVKMVQSGVYGTSSPSGDTALREQLPDSYYAFIDEIAGRLPEEMQEKYDYDNGFDLLNIYDNETHACILDGEPDWEDYSTADKRKLNALEKRWDSDKISSEEYSDTWDKITDKYSTQKFHRNEASRVKCRYCGPVIKALNNMNNWNWQFLEEGDFWKACKSDKIPTRELKSLTNIILGKAPAKKAKPKATTRKAKAKPKAKAGRKSPDISATKRKIGTRMRGNDGKMWEVKPAGKSQRWVRGAETFEASRGNRKHQMMTKELSSKIPKLYSQEEVSDPTVVAHYFTPYGRGDWFVIEWDGEDMMYGLADLGYPELGYFSLSELESAYRGGLPLVERDLHWTPVPLSEVQKTRMAAEVHDGESELEQLGENGFQYYATYIYPANAGEEGLENLLSIERLEDGYFRVGEYSYRGNPETSTHGQYAGQWLVDKSSRKLDWDDISSYSKLYEENYATWDDVINDRPSEYLASEEGSAPIQRPMDFGEPVNWTPHDGTPSLRKRQRAEDSKTSANEPVPAADYEFYYRSLLE
jgi:hypothetical protein